MMEGQFNPFGRFLTTLWVHEGLVEDALKRGREGGDRTPGAPNGLRPFITLGTNTGSQSRRVTIIVEPIARRTQALPVDPRGSGPPGIIPV